MYSVESEMAVRIRYSCVDRTYDGFAQFQSCFGYWNIDAVQEVLQRIASFAWLRVD